MRGPKSLHESPHDRDDLDISQARFKQVAQRIREWAPMILESPNGEDHRIPIYQEIQFLEGCADVFSPDPEPPPDHGFMFAAAVMLEVISFSSWRSVPSTSPSSPRWPWAFKRSSGRVSG